VTIRKWCGTTEYLFICSGSVNFMDRIIATSCALEWRMLHLRLYLADNQQRGWDCKEVRRDPPFFPEFVKVEEMYSRIVVSFEVRGRVVSHTSMSPLEIEYYEKIRRAYINFVLLMMIHT
jgi:hypothetical protein